MIPIVVSDAKPQLGDLIDRVIATGNPVILQRGDDFVQIAPAPLPYPISGYPEGSLAFDPNEFPFNDDSICEGEDIPLIR